MLRNVTVELLEFMNHRNRKFFCELEFEIFIIKTVEGFNLKRKNLYWFIDGIDEKAKIYRKID